MRLAIIIPTLNEQSSLRRGLESARMALDQCGGGALVVADGGSRDDTLAEAGRAGARIASSAAGRGPQLNAGASLALAEGAGALLFLHADTLLSKDAGSRVLQALDEGAVGGGFLIQFDSESKLLALGQRLVNARTRRFRIPLGDQAQFASAQAFRAAEGFPAWPILEDLELLRRLKKQGRLEIIRSPVTTSARRFQERGVVRTVVGNWLIWALFLAGVGPDRLSRLYRHVR